MTLAAHSRRKICYYYDSKYCDFTILPPKIYAKEMNTTDLILKREVKLLTKLLLTIFLPLLFFLIVFVLCIGVYILYASHVFPF